MLMISRWSQQPHLPSYYAKPSSSVTELLGSFYHTCILDRPLTPTPIALVSTCAPLAYNPAVGP
ncbi:hypothetical protein FRC08_017183, partial [Ceratobasidium sp. 394]